MCCNVKGCCGKGCRCVPAKVGKALLIIGGINWGLVGAGMLFTNGMGSWNLVDMIFGTMPMLEGVIYLLVGIAAVMAIFGCKCKKCKAGMCNVDSKMGGTMDSGTTGKM